MFSLDIMNNLKLMCLLEKINDRSIPIDDSCDVIFLEDNFSKRVDIERVVQIYMT